MDTNFAAEHCFTARDLFRRRNYNFEGFSLHASSDRDQVCDFGGLRPLLSNLQSRLEHSKKSGYASFQTIYGNVLQESKNENFEKMLISMIKAVDAAGAIVTSREDILMNVINKEAKIVFVHCHVNAQPDSDSSSLFRYKTAPAVEGADPTFYATLSKLCLQNSILLVDTYDRFALARYLSAARAKIEPSSASN